MRVFVTGASGHIAFIRELLSAGHAVTGLARSDRAAAAVEALAIPALSITRVTAQDAAD